MIEKMALDLLGLGILLSAIGELTVLAVIVVSIVWPETRIWPPGDVSWRFWAYWAPSIVFIFGLAFVGYRTAGGFVFTGLLWSGAGILLLVAAIGLLIWVYLHFTVREGAGLEGELETGGPYQVTRNPQVIGMLLVTAGLVILVNSRIFTMLCMPLFLIYSLMPFAEESWLHEEFGEEYEQYREAVPRFVGRRSMKRLPGL